MPGGDAREFKVLISWLPNSAGGAPEPGTDTTWNALLVESLGRLTLASKWRLSALGLRLGCLESRGRESLGRWRSGAGCVCDAPTTSIHSNNLIERRVSLAAESPFPQLRTFEMSRGRGRIARSLMTIRQAPLTADERVAGLASWAVVFCAVLLWTSAGESAMRYIVYGLPLTAALVWLMFSGGRPLVAVPAVFAFGAYALVASISLYFNGPTEDSLRDVIIIASYISLFCFHARSPRIVADLTLFTLTAGLMVEGLIKGISLTVNFLDSEGILESGLAFPLGLVFLYYYNEKKWGRTLISLFLLFVAFKRIALLAVLLVIASNALLRMIGRPGIGRSLAFVTAICLSVLALSLQPIFTFMADYLHIDDFSPSRLSLGRFDIAGILWQIHGSAAPVQMLFGFGPGAADTFLGGVQPPHNDWLKILFDYGYVGFVGFHFILFLLFGKKPLGIQFYVYTAVLMMSDNVLIYLYYWVFVSQILNIESEPQVSARAVPRWRFEDAFGRQRLAAGP
jgi:hypothetical protein